MNRLEETCAGLEGREFDWLLMDVTGAIAVCETAGFGEVPEVVLNLGLSRLESYADAIRSILIELPETGSCRQERQGVGTDVETLGFGTRGLYVYDWKHWSGPYERIVVPAQPSLLDVGEGSRPDLGGAVPQVSIEFASSSEFDLTELLPCRGLRSI